MARVYFSSVIPVPRSQLFQYLFRAEDWEKGLPVGLGAELIEKGPVREGTKLKFRLNRYGVSFLWELQIDEIVADQRVSFKQTLGFLESWHHEQVLEDHGSGQTVLKDYIDYEMPLGIFGKLADDLVFRRDLKKMLEDRHDRIRLGMV